MFLSYDFFFSFSKRQVEKLKVSLFFFLETSTELRMPFPLKQNDPK